MGIQEDVVKDFFNKLEKDAEFPNGLVRKLKKLWKSDETFSSEKILKALTGGIKGSNKNQDH